MGRPKKIVDECLPAEEAQEKPKKLIFTCNVNHDNKEYKAGDEWPGEAPEVLLPFLKSE